MDPFDFEKETDVISYARDESPGGSIIAVFEASVGTKNCVVKIVNSIDTTVFTINFVTF